MEVLELALKVGSGPSPVSVTQKTVKSVTMTLATALLTGTLTATPRSVGGNVLDNDSEYYIYGSRRTIFGHMVQLCVAFAAGFCG